MESKKLMKIIVIIIIIIIIIIILQCNRIIIPHCTNSDINFARHQKNNLCFFFNQV